METSSDVQRITETINGLVYRIEITPVAEDKWRAQLLRQHGGPTALMPFYGQTPEEAEQQLSAWLLLAHHSTSQNSS